MSSTMMEHRSLLERMRSEIRKFEYSDEEVLNRSRRAGALLQDDVLQNAFEQAEVEFYAIWLDPESDTQAQQEARAAVLAMAEVKRVLHSFLAAGQVIEEQSEQED